MENFSYFCALLFSIVLLSGCVNASTSHVPGVSYPALAENAEVTVYASEIPKKMTGIENASSAPSGTRLGTVSVNGAEAASWNAVISRAKREARKMGADVLVVEQWGYVPITSYAYSGGMAVPVTAQSKGLTAEARRTYSADRSSYQSSY